MRKLCSPWWAWQLLGGALVRCLSAVCLGQDAEKSCYLGGRKWEWVTMNRITSEKVEKAAGPPPSLPFWLHGWVGWERLLCWFHFPPIIFLPQHSSSPVFSPLEIWKVSCSCLFPWRISLIAPPDWVSLAGWWHWLYSISVPSAQLGKCPICSLYSSFYNYFTVFLQGWREPLIPKANIFCCLCLWDCLWLYFHKAFLLCLRTFLEMSHGVARTLATHLPAYQQQWQSIYSPLQLAKYICIEEICESNSSFSIMDTVTMVTSIGGWENQGPGLSQIRGIRSGRDEIPTQIHHWLQSGVLFQYSNPHPEATWRMSLPWQKLTLILGREGASVAQSADTIMPLGGAGSFLGALWCTLHPFLDDPTPQKGKHSHYSSKWRDLKVG